MCVRVCLHCIIVFVVAVLIVAAAVLVVEGVRVSMVILL